MAHAADSGHDLGESIDAGRGELLKVLLRHRVEFVVIGGAAIQSHGRRYVTEDIDLTPDTDEANLQRCRRCVRYVAFNKQSVEVTVLPSGLVTVRPLVALLAPLPVTVTLIDVELFQVKLFTL